jgi:hypothetical protein
VREQKKLSKRMNHEGTKARSCTKLFFVFLSVLSVFVVHAQVPQEVMQKVYDEVKRLSNTGWLLHLKMRQRKLIVHPSSAKASIGT